MKGNKLKNLLKNKLFFAFLIIFSLVITVSNVNAIPNVDPDKIPRIRDIGLDINALSEIVKSKQLILLHPKQKLTISVQDKPKEFDNVRFISGIALINAPVEEVKKIITDFDHYTEFMPMLRNAAILEKTKDTITSDYDLVIKLPLINIGFQFVLVHKFEKNGDITWDLKEGDMSVNIGRWETIAVSKNQTLLINTFWSDYKSVGILMRLLLNAQPDLEIAIPVSSAAMIMDSIKKRAEVNIPQEKPDLEYLPASPVIPLITKGSISKKTLYEINKIGTILFIHKPSWIETESGPLEMKFITAGGLINAPIEKVKELSLSFDRYHEFFQQVAMGKKKKHEYGFVADWSLKFSFVVFNIYVDFTTENIWANKNIITYKRIDGDLEHIYGCWEWLPVEQDKTLLFFTTAAPMGQKAPLLFKIAQMIPNSQVVMGASAGTVIIEKQIPWIEEQTKKLTENNKK